MRSEIDSVLRVPHCVREDLGKSKKTIFEMRLMNVDADDKRDLGMMSCHDANPIRQ